MSSHTSAAPLDKPASPPPATATSPRILQAATSLNADPTPQGASAAEPKRARGGDAAASTSNTPKRRRKSRGSLCGHQGCLKLAKTGGMCIAHGGGRRCQFLDCTSSDQGRGLCKKHGGGKRCQYPGGCVKSDVGFGRCTAHGGGRRCEFVDEQGVRCVKSDQGGHTERRCKAHGGGRKCTHESGCTRADAGGGFCRAHGGGKSPKKTATVFAPSSSSSSLSAAAGAGAGAAALPPMVGDLLPGAMTSGAFLMSPGHPAHQTAHLSSSPSSVPYSRFLQEQQRRHTFANLGRAPPPLLDFHGTMGATAATRSTSPLGASLQNPAAFGSRASSPRLQEHTRGLLGFQMDLNQAANRLSHQAVAHYGQQAIAQNNNQPLLGNSLAGLYSFSPTAQPMLPSPHPQSMQLQSAYGVNLSGVAGSPLGLPPHLNIGLTRTPSLESVASMLLRRQASEPSGVSQSRASAAAAGGGSSQPLSASVASSLGVNVGLDKTPQR